MRNMLLTTALLFAAAPALAAELAIGTPLGTSVEDIRAALTEMGWDVRKFEIEANEIEVDAVMGIRMVEIYIDPKTGTVVKIEDED